MNLDFVKDENGSLLAESHNILNMWKNYVHQLLNLHGANNDRRIEIHTPGPLITGAYIF
jgi:hypothetical protein